MPALLETAPAALKAMQADFASALFDRRRVPEGLGARHGTPSRRFDVYRNNIVAALIGCLGSTYPAVRRLVGDDFFNAMARLFIEGQPPASPVLLEYGAGLDAFIQSFEPAAGVPYLADVARLEWHVARACHAEDAEPIDGNAVADMTADEVARARLLLHPSLRLMRSPYPVVSIWRANVRNERSVRIAASPNGEAAMIVRPHFAVEVEQVERGAFEFLAALAAGYSLGQASAFAVQCSANFDLATTLVQIFSAGAVVDIVPAGQPHPLLQPSKGSSHA